MKKILLLLVVLSLLPGCIRRDSNFRRRESRFEREEDQFSERRKEPFEEIRSPRRRRHRRQAASRYWSDIEPGTVEIAGNLDFSFTSLDVEIDGSESADTNTKTLEISTLYYMAPNLGIGFEFFAENSKASSGGDSVEVKTLAIGPQVGANFPINDVTSFRLLGSVLLADIDVSNSFGDVEKADGLALGLSVGMSHFFAESVSLNGGLSYIKMSLDTKSSNLNVDIDGLRFGLGLSVYLR